jgi:LysM repeat protein
MNYKIFLNNLIVILFLIIAPTLSAQSGRISREEYIQRYKDLAIAQMNISGIPASIIMAQACFESDNGNSRLAKEANNHFGIKCHTSWTGPSIRHDDDALQECFRKYDSPEGSYSDHSDFLRYRDRYAFLFNLASNDYKGWAEGLKKAGYATNPAYAERLIKIIEDNKLYELDAEQPLIAIPSPVDIEKAQTVLLETKQVVKTKETVDIDHFAFTLGREEYRRNGAKFVLARNKDSYEAIAVDMSTKVKKLYQYNDISKSIALKEGDVVYIEPKQSSTVESLPMHIAESGETLWSISQRYGVALKSLYQYNSMKSGQEPAAGQEVFLRKKKAPADTSASSTNLKKTTKKLF